MSFLLCSIVSSSCEIIELPTSVCESRLLSKLEFCNSELWRGYATIEKGYHWCSVITSSWVTIIINFEKDLFVIGQCSLAYTVTHLCLKLCKKNCTQFIKKNVCKTHSCWLIHLRICACDWIVVYFSRIFFLIFYLHKYSYPWYTLTLIFIWLILFLSGWLSLIKADFFLGWFFFFCSYI